MSAMVGQGNFLVLGEKYNLRARPLSLEGSHPNSQKGAGRSASLGCTWNWVAGGSCVHAGSFLVTVVSLLMFLCPVKANSAPAFLLLGACVVAVNDGSCSTFEVSSHFFFRNDMTARRKQLAEKEIIVWLKVKLGWVLGSQSVFLGLLKFFPWSGLMACTVSVFIFLHGPTALTSVVPEPAMLKITITKSVLCWARASMNLC